MPTLKDHLARCKTRLVSYGVGSSQPVEVEQICELLFLILDTAGTHKRLIEVSNQLLMIFSEDPPSWTDEFHQQFDKNRELFLQMEAEVIDDSNIIESENFVVFRPTFKRLIEGIEPSIDSKEDIDQFIDIFVEESNFQLETVVNILLEYEQSKAKVNIQKIIAPLRNILANAQQLQCHGLVSTFKPYLDFMDKLSAAPNLINSEMLNLILFLIDKLNVQINSLSNGETFSKNDITEFLTELKMISTPLPPMGPSTQGPSEEIIEVFEVFRPTKSKLPLESLEFLPDFILESQEHLQNLEDALQNILTNGKSKEDIAKAFRAFHTIKGVSGFLGLNQTEKLTHQTEDVLANIRDQNLSFPKEACQLFFDISYALQSNLQSLSDKQQEDIPQLPILLSRLKELDLNEKITASKVLHSAIVESKKDEFLRVQLSDMDRLLQLVGELTLAKNSLHQLTKTRQILDLDALYDTLKGITQEFESKLLSIRLQPLSMAFRKLPRLVREVASKSNKSVNLEINGESNLLDKRILESLQAPILHLVRNAVDHGIETPEVRVQKGKSEEGTLQVSAFQENNQIVVRIQDDGKGIDLDKLLQKAIDKNLISAEEAAQLSRQQVGELIYLPGLSTQEVSTSLSGRGVGMDVVKSTVDRLSGAIDIQTEKDKGCLFTLRIPLTLTIIKALTLPVHGINYFMPQHNLLEVIPQNQIRRTHVEDHPAFEHSSGLIPILNLTEILDLPPAQATNIILCTVGESRIAISVPEVSEIQEIVVQPLNSQLKTIRVFEGATILGDSSIGIVLSAAGIAEPIPAEFKRLRRNQPAVFVNHHRFLQVWLAQNKSVVLPLEIIIRAICLPSIHRVSPGWHSIEVDNESLTIYVESDTELDILELILLSHSSNETLGIPIIKVGDILSVNERDIHHSDDEFPSFILNQSQKMNIYAVPPFPLIERTEDRP